MDFSGGIEQVRLLLLSALVCVVIAVMLAGAFKGRKGRPGETWNISLAMAIPLVVGGVVLAVGIMTLGPDVARSFGLTG